MRWKDGLIARTRTMERDSAAYKVVEAAYIKQAGPAPKSTLQQVADHIDHVAKVAGVDHVGLAADFDGGATTEGLQDVSTYPALFAELIQRGWKDADLAKLAGGNIIRALAKAEQVAARLQKERAPSLAALPSK
jgi:membrane dipeptidase